MPSRDRRDGRSASAGTARAAVRLMKKEPEHQDDTPNRPIENAVESDDADVILDDDVDFTDQPLVTDSDEAVEGDTDTTYFPPTDPVLRPGAHGEPEVLGGFAP